MTHRTRLEISGWTRALNQRLEAQAEKLGMTKVALARNILHQDLPLIVPQTKGHLAQKRCFPEEKKIEIPQE